MYLLFFRKLYIFYIFFHNIALFTQIILNQLYRNACFDDTQCHLARMNKELNH